MPDFDKRSALTVSPIVPVSSGQVLLSPTVARWHKPVFILFLLAWAVNLAVLLLRLDLRDGGRWIEAAFLLLGVATSMLGLARRLPFRPSLRFLYVYVFQGGFLDGRRGYYFARLHAFYEFMSVAKTAELRRQNSSAKPGAS